MQIHKKRTDMRERYKWYIEVVMANKSTYCYAMTFNDLHKFIASSTIELKKINISIISKYVIPSVRERYKTYSIKSIKVKEVANE